MQPKRIAHLFALGLAGLVLSLFVLRVGAPAGAATSVLTATPSADASTHASYPTTNYGAATTLDTDATPARNAYLKFTLSGLLGSINGVQLRLFTRSSISTSPLPRTLRELTGTWTETGITSANAPAFGPAIASFTPTVLAYSSVDVTAYVKRICGSAANCTVAFGISTADQMRASFDSREGASKPQLVVSHSSTTTTSTTTTTTPTTTTPPTDPVIAAGGDIAGSWTQDSATASLLDAILPAAVLTAGDNAYNTGTSSEFSTYYGPTWGRHKSKTHPTPGNHDHANVNANNLGGYCGYFGASFCNGTGTSTYSYYSFNVGAWHLIALDSGCSSPSTCADPMVAGSAMRTWLTNDLAANAKACTLAYWHHPKFSSGVHGNDTRASLASVWQQLYNAKVDVIVNGHDHNYERFAPQAPTGVLDNANGIREFVVGTGGAALRAFSTIRANSQARNSVANGVLKLTLHPTSYDWAFTPIAGQTFTDAGSTACH